MLLSTSGNSQNLVNAAMTAKALNMRIIVLTGPTIPRRTDPILRSWATNEMCLQSPCTRPEDIQQDHQIFYHTICEAVEFELYGGKSEHKLS